MESHVRVVAVFGCCLLLLTLPVGAVADNAVASEPAVSDAESTPQTTSATPQATTETTTTTTQATPQGATTPQATTATTPVACFPPSGYGFTIGTLGPQIDMIVHLSLLTNLGGPGTLGIELAGAVDDTEPIIELRTGAVFHGVTDVESFLSNPFGLFSIAYEYRFQLPMFENGIDYETTEPPISGPVGESRC